MERKEAVAVHNQANYPASRDTTQDANTILVLARLFLLVAEGVKGSLSKQIVAKIRETIASCSQATGKTGWHHPLGRWSPTEAEGSTLPRLSFLLLCFSPGLSGKVGFTVSDHSSTFHLAAL